MNKILEKLLAEKTFAGVRQYLSDGITKKETWSGEYDWAAAALKSTDFFVAEYLKKKMPAGVKEHPEQVFDPCLFEDHLNEASDLLDLCLVKRKEIQELETEAVTTALDYMLAEALQPGTLSIEKVELKANRLTAKATKDDADEPVLIYQDELNTYARRLHLSMHTTPSHPLNFGERIDFLRNLYADNILSVYERLYSARLGLKAAGIIDISPVNVWTKEGPDNLANLVYWVRDAISAYEHRQLNESVATQVFRLGEIYPGGIAALREFMALNGRRDIKFTLEPGHFKRAGTHRILRLGVALSFKSNIIEYTQMYNNETNRGIFVYVDDWHRSRLREMSFPTTVKMPLQRVEFNSTESYSWSKTPLTLESEVAVWNGFPDKFASAMPQFKNANPIGEWLISFDGVVADAERIGIALNSMKTGSNNILWNLSDVVLYLQIATVD